MFALFILVLFCIYFISKKLSKYINDNVENLTLAFEKASSKNKKIDTLISILKKLPLTFYQADDGICRHSHRLL
jgi:F0F1-type ATP synthase membrane subunit b/b'